MVHRHEPEPDPSLLPLTRAIALRRSLSASCPPSFGAVAARSPTPAAVSRLYVRGVRRRLDAGTPAPLTTQVTWEQPRTIITRNDLPDIPFDRSINPYRGCEHGCFYCYARPTHAYMGLSAGLDFETRLFSKENAAELLERELASPEYKPAPIAFGETPTPTSRSSASTASPGR